MYFVHPSTGISVDISTDSRPTYQSTYRPSVDRYVGRHIGQVSANMSTEMCRLIYRPTYRSSIGQYVDWHSTDMSVDMSSDCRPTCRSIGYRHSADTSLATCVLVIVSNFCSADILDLLPGFSEGYFVYNPASQFYTSTLLSFAVLIHFPVNCILCIWQYFTWVSYLITTEFAAHEGQNMKPSEIFEVDQKDEMSITYTV